QTQPNVSPVSSLPGVLPQLRISTRYDKDPRNFLAAVKLVALRIWCAP
ncbi:MAG: hypothetical protein FD119_3864, partial [Stygiobacter sp.]